MTVSRTQLINEIADALDGDSILGEVTEEFRAGTDKKLVKEVLETFEEVVIDSVRQGERVTLGGFIAFSRKDIPARKAKKNVPNPFKPGETMDQKARPASKSARVTVLKKFKDRVGAKR